MENAQVEMPKYKSHKEVHALKIKSITYDKDLAENRETDGSALLHFEAPFSHIKVDYTYVQKHKPQAVGYYVVYEDGYKSWSPAEAFEGGYTKV